MEDLLIIGGLLAVIALVVLWFVVLPRFLDRVPKGWSIGPTVGGKNLSPGVRLDGQTFTFPTEPRSVHAMLFRGLDLAHRTKLILRCRIEAEPGVTFHPQETPDAEATVSLMIQREGDDYSAKGRLVEYRLYAPAVLPLAPGEYTLAVYLDEPSGWISVLGAPATQAQMDAVVDDLRAVHIAFGSSFARAHGVFVRGGKASFRVLELRAE